MTERKHGDERGKFDSPACSMHEADDAYMGFAGPDEIVPLLQELLEAERAGARVALQSARGAADEQVAELMRAIHHDEAHWCAMLASHIKALGQRPSMQVGAFHAKAMAIGDLYQRIEFLNRGQAWVVRRLREMLPRLRNDALHKDLSRMLLAHEANIDRAIEVIRPTPR